METKQDLFEEAKVEISKAMHVIPQVVTDMRINLHNTESPDNLVHFPEQNLEKESKFKQMINSVTPNKFDQNSPYRLSLDKTRYLETMEEKWILLNEYQTKGVSTWSKLILDVSGQMDYRDIMLDFFNYFIAPTLSSAYHYGQWLNLMKEKDISRDVLMVGMQQTIRKDDPNNPNQ